jgi:hypothetical protein
MLARNDIGTVIIVISILEQPQYIEAALAADKDVVESHHGSHNTLGLPSLVVGGNRHFEKWTSRRRGKYALCISKMLSLRYSLINISTELYGPFRQHW